MKARNVKQKAPESLADRYSAGHKAISVVLSVVLLGFGWPAVNPAEIYADDSAAQAEVAADAQTEVGTAPATSADDSTSAAQGETAESTQAAATQAPAAAVATDNSADANASNSAASNNAAATVASAPAAEATSYDLKLELNNASLKTVASSTVDVQVINPPSTKVTVPAKKDFKFTVTAASGYKLDKVNLTIAGVETELSADDQGVYTIPAESLAADMSLELATSADNQAATQAASDAVAITSIDDGNAVDSIPEVEVGHTYTFSAKHEGNWSITEGAQGEGSWYGKQFTIRANAVGKVVTATCSYSENNVSKTETFQVKTVDQKDSTVCGITGPTEVMSNIANKYPAREESTITLTESKGTSWEWHLAGDGAYDAASISQNGNQATITGLFHFTGASKTIQVTCTYSDNPWVKYTDTYNVTINKRAMKVTGWTYVEGTHYGVPTVVDAITGESLNQWEGGYQIEYFINGKSVGNAPWTGNFKNDQNSYDVKIYPFSKDNDGWNSAYAAGREYTDPQPGDVDPSEEPKIELGVDGPSTVEQFNTIDLTATLTPAQDGGTYTWSSNNENILTVDENGKVTGVSEGTATVTVTWTSADGKTTLSATHDVTVTHTTNATNDITFYYLNDPDGNLDGIKNFNQWEKIGKGKANLSGLIGTKAFPKDNGNTKIYNAGDRIVSWPSGLEGTSSGSTFELQKGSTHWNKIFANYKELVEQKLNKNVSEGQPKKTVTEKDIKSIKLVPYKLTNNDDGIHVDCQVLIECQDLYSVRFKVWDPSEGDTGFVTVGSSSIYESGDSVKPSDFNLNYPETKTKNGVEYTFSGWCLDDALTQSVSMPYTVANSNLEFYAKYTAGRQVIYNLNGGTWNNGSTTKKVDEGAQHTVLSAPTKEGFDFAGWDVAGLEDTNTINSGDTFTMPGNNVTLTAKWTAKDATLTVNYLWGDKSDNTLIESTTTDTKWGNTDSIEQKSFDGYTIKPGQQKSVYINEDQKTVNIYYYKNVTLTGAIGAKTYNGEEQSIEGYTSSVDTDGNALKFDGVKAEGKGTNAGEYDVVFNGGAKGVVSGDGKYIVTETVNGKLTINPISDEIKVVITGNTDTKKYDGDEHSVEGYTVTLPENTLYKENYIQRTGEAKAAGKDYADGGYAMGLTSDQFKNTNDNFTKVKFEVADGKLTIKKRNVTLTSATDSKDYDGTALTNHNVKVTGDGFVEGEGVDYTFTGSQTIPGTSSNSFSYTKKDGTNLDNYIISKSEGELTVNELAKKYDVTVSAESDTVEYDAHDHSVSKSLTGTSFEWNGAKFNISGLEASGATGRDAGTYANTITGTATVTDENGNDVTSQFNVIKNDGTLTITKKQATIKSSSSTKVYDGKPLTKHEVTTSGFFGTDAPTVTFTGSQTDVGKTENTFTYTKTGNVEKNYEVKVEYGWLEVTQNEAKVVVNIQMKSNTVVYNGKAQQVSGYDVLSIEGDESYKADYVDFSGSPVSGTNAGTYTNDGKGKFSNTNPGYKNVEFNVTNGELKIEKRPVTLTSGSGEKTYDGSELTKNELTVSPTDEASGFVGTQGVKSFKCTGSQLNAGSSDNDFTYELYGTTNRDNYDIKEVKGTLKVNPVNDEVVVTVTGVSETAEYNGTEQTTTGKVSFESNNSLYTDKNFKYTGPTSVSGTDAGTYEKKMSGTNFENTSSTNFPNVTFKYDSQSVKLEIKPRPVTLTSGDGEWVYDGGEHSVPSVEDTYASNAETKGFLGTDGATYTNFAKVKNVVSDASNTFDYTLNDGTNGKNYVITKAPGKLTVTKKDIADEKTMTVEPLSDVVYNGSEQKFEPVVKDGGTRLVKDRDYTLSYSEDLVNVGKVTVAIDGIGNYKGATKVEYSITKRPVKLVSFDGAWTYDGKEHSDHEVLVTSYYNFVNGEVSNLQATGAITEPGSVKNAISFTKNENYKDANYDVTMTEGMLTVNAKDLNDKDMSVEQLNDVPYNGQDQYQYPQVTDGDKTLVEGTDYDISFSGDVKNVTKEGVTVTITGKGNYKGTVERAYRITPAKLTVKTESDSRAYNGKDLTAGGSIDGFVNGESAAFTVTGKQNSVGSSTNTYEINWDGATASKSNYDIDEQLGMLTVTESTDEIVVTTVGGSYTYDGLTHEPTVTVSNLPEGYTVQSAVSNTTAKDVNTNADGKGGVAVTADTLVILNANKENVTSKLNIKKVDGTLAITPARVVVNTPSANKVYDGEALTAAGSISGLMPGETVDFKTTGTQTKEGTSDNTYELNWTGSAKESNYTVEKSVGKLTVTKQSITPGDGETPDPSYKGITISDPSDAKYDGADHKWAPVVKDANGNELVAGSDYQVTYDTDNFKDAKTIKVTIEGINNYAGKVEKTYKITPRTVVLKSDDGSWTYDGDTHQAASVAVVETSDGFVPGEGVTYKDFATVKDVVAGKDNTFGYDWKDGTLSSNYEVSQTYGKLSVTKAEAEGSITLTGKDATKTYDGKPISAAAAAATVGFGNSVKIEYSTDQVNWTENPADIRITDVTDSKTVYVRASSEANYGGYVYTKESLSVTPATVKVTTPTASKVYNGKALTAEGTVSGIVDGETVGFETTGSQTGVGASSNTYKLTWSDGTAGSKYTAKESNYTVEDSVGKLTVAARSIADTEYGMAVDSPSNIEYDGAAHQWAPTVTDNGKILTAGTDYEVAYSKDDFTNVTGEISVTITGKGNYTGTVTKKYQITPAPLTVTTEGASKVYDNTPLTHDVASIAGLKNGETATIHATGSQTVVGDSDNGYEITWNDTTAKSNYEVKNVTLGKLTVTETEAAIVATPQTVTATYDGQAHGTTVEVTGVPTGYSVKTATSKATATNVADGTVAANVDDLVIVNAQGVDVTKELNITRNTGTITINPATLTVTTEGASKEYDGTALTNSTIDVSGFVNNESAKAETTGSITEVGKTSNGYKLDWGKVDSRNYSVSEALGTLEVTESNKAVEITSASASKTYDGSALTANDATATGLPAGFTVAVSTKASQTDAGTADNAIDSYQIFNADGKDVTKMFAKVSTVSGKLTVNKKDITVTTEGATKVFDGTALTNNKGSIDGLVQGETATVQPNGTQTAVGSSSNGYAIAWGSAKEGNYNVASSTLGTLAVTSQSLNPEDPSYKGISVSDPSDTTYDGTSHTWAPTVTDAKGNVLTPGTDYDVTFNTNDFTDAGTITATITGKGNYTGTVTKSYTIAKAKVSISTESADKVYDGDALTAGGEIAGLVNNETVDFAATGSQTAVGSSTNGYRLAWTGTAKVSNYQIESIKLGALTVKQSEDEIVVTTVGGTFTYDGQAHGATVTVSTLPQGYTLDSASSDASATDANGEGIEATANNLVIRNAAGQDVTSDLKVTYVNGTIVVKPAELSIETGSASKVFDGTAITAAGSIKGFVNGEDATFTVTGSQTEVGSSQNGYELSFDKKAKEDNYVIASEDLGTLAITAQSITPGDGDTPSADYRGIEVTTPTDVVYDNAQHQWTPVVTDANGNVLTEGVDYEVAYDTDDFVNVGQIAVAITGMGNYKGTVVRTYRITPAALTITTGSATKVFDGSALTSSELSIEGLKGADAVAARTTGEQTEVGSSQNTYAIDWRDVNQANYEVTEQLGTLTVEAAPVVPVPGTDQPGTDQPGGTTPDGTNPGTTPGGTPATTGTTGTTPAPAGPIEAIGQVLEAGYEAITGDTSASPAAEEQIYDEENPLGKAEHQTCWVHFYMILGMLLTALYGVLVWLRRGNHTRKLRNDMNDILDGGDGDSKESPAATNQPATEA